MKNFISHILLLLFFSSGLFFRCANPASPSGGPKDTIPPKITSIIPNNFSTNFKAQKIIMTFDEYTVLKDAHSEIVIAPPMKKRPTFSIKGRSLEITMESELDSATTYKIDFGKALRDNNEANVLMNFNYIFSTGDYIDLLVMSGQLINAETGDTVINGLVYLFNEDSDSLQVDSTIYIGRPLSVARTDSSGVFVATNLKDMNYIVYGIEDKNSNSYYDIGDDKVAFSEESHNPANMSPFKIWFNKYTQTYQATPQFQFRSFSERQKGRQSLQEITRSQRGILTFIFGADSARVESIQLDSISPDLLYSEFKPTGDTLTVWIMQPDSIIPDTLRGAINYHVLSTLGEDSVATRKINLISLTLNKNKRNARQKDNNKQDRGGGGSSEGGRQGMGSSSDGNRPEKGGDDERGGDGERSDDDERPTENNMQDNTENNLSQAGGAIIKFPLSTSSKDQKNIVSDVAFNFTVPIKEFNKGLIKLEMAIPEEAVKGDRRAQEEKVETKVEDLKRKEVDFTFKQDSTTALTWRLDTDWQPNTTYFFYAKDSAFINIKGGVSDSLVHKIEVMNPEEKSIIILDVVNADTSINYIIELLDSKSGKMLYQNQYTSNGSYIMDYINPGKYKIKVIKDVNNNGKWDSGELLIRKSPERVAIYSDENKLSIFETMANWEQTIEIDISKLF